MDFRDPVLIVDDDVVYRDTLVAELRRQSDMDLVEASTIDEARSRVRDFNGKFDAVVLDLGLPDGGGQLLCRDLRQVFPNVPILIMTGREAAGSGCDEGDAAGCFDAGATDYIRKPVRAAELLARLRAHRRSVEMSIDAAMPIGRFTFRPAQRSLFDRSNMQRTWLTSKEVGILRVLYQAAGKPVSREALLQEVWSLASDATTHTLETHIYRLRQKLGCEGLIVTRRGGYLLAG